MKTIWKFTLQLSDSQRVEMPKGAAILTVQPQGNQVCMWAIVEIGEATETEMRTFEIYGTGTAIREEKGIERNHVATFQQPPFVWHVFERIAS